jgi:hypothetical protein
LLEKHEQDFDKQFEANEVALEKLNQQVEKLHTLFPALNENVCGAKGDPCDEICGGPTCGRLVSGLPSHAKMLPQVCAVDQAVIKAP